VSREPNEADHRHLKGGKAAERLREFLAARFGDKAPPIPPDELPSDEELPDEAAPLDRDSQDEAGAPPTPRQSP
jgi:hypothetical protein